jgi:uncharacterized protein (UPF0262 family)
LSYVVVDALRILARAHRSIYRQRAGVLTIFTIVLVDIRIHEPIWSAATTERRREWLLLIAELLERHPPDEGEGLRLIITPLETKSTTLGFERIDGQATSEISLPSDVLHPHFREYCEICQRMWMIDEGSHSARVEALDMGKKVAHDRAARTLVHLCSPQFSDHATARCLFSLLVSLHFDTARMMRGHRLV